MKWNSGQAAIVYYRQTKMKKAEYNLALMVVCMLSVFQKCETSGANCLSIVKHVYHSLGIRSHLSDSSDIAGEWTSSNCEVRPGPQFFTRYIKILTNGTWEGYFHRYNDSACSEPKLSLYMHGFYKVYNEPLETIKGSNRAFFNFTGLELYPHNAYEQEKIINVSRKHCPNTIPRFVGSVGSNKAVFEVNIRAFRKRACRNSYGFLESEFSAIKLETRRRKGSDYDRLFFAEIPTIKVTRRYKPKGYQLPLQRYDAHNCTNCMKIQSGTGSRPPQLPRKELPRRSFVLNGKWASSTCETTLGGTFLTRHFKFNSASLSWEAHYYFYLNSDCKSLDFELIGKGHFTAGIPSKVVAGARDYVFTMTEAFMTPFDPVTTRLLNTLKSNSCGKQTWVTGKTQDLTPTGGCAMYGISLPHTEYDLLKMETTTKGSKLLYVGQRPSDLSDPNSPSKRATSFQIPLVECSSFNIKFVPPTTRPTTRPNTRRTRSPILKITIPTLRRRETTTRRRGDRETTTNTVDNTNVITNDKTPLIAAVKGVDNSSSGMNWPSSCQPMLMLSLAAVFIFR